jgi:hypothetical protein
MIRTHKWPILALLSVLLLSVFALAAPAKPYKQNPPAAQDKEQPTASPQAFQARIHTHECTVVEVKTDHGTKHMLMCHADDKDMHAATAAERTAYCDKAWEEFNYKYRQIGRPPTNAMIDQCEGTVPRAGAEPRASPINR